MGCTVNFKITLDVRMEFLIVPVLNTCYVVIILRHVR